MKSIPFQPKNIKLRKKAPFWCRAKSIDGKSFIHLGYALAETDDELCPEHAKEAADRRHAFYNKPINSPALGFEIPTDCFGDPILSREDEDKAWQERLAKGPIWPVDAAWLAARDARRAHENLEGLL